MDEETRLSKGDAPLNKDFKRNLSAIQEQLVEAIEKGDKIMFQKLGGGRDHDLNFEITSEGIFPLLIACARGDLEMTQLIL
jgi:hypothetical protein